ncbi:CHAT domain-containing protein [uncultured Dokdonia sp.]|uniref:CHAT domain-containing protein n=1 Tax=uncultured Dokdonia sp. TaxID=575653 RepID=UPI00262CA993|nr:CHAT domain-containing protein [uncultured Dokdonia sp.]
MKIPKILSILLVVFGLFTSHAQEELFYKALDNFLSSPSPEELSVLIQKTDALQIQDADSQLAKVVVDCNIAYYQTRYGNISAAIHRYEAALERYRSRQLSGYDMITSAMIPLGNLYTQTNAYTEAENTIRAYITLSRKANQPNHLLSGLINLSVPLQNQGKYENAIRVLEEAKKISPENIDIQINLATNYFSKGDHTQAEALAKEVVTADPKQINGYKLLAQIAIQQENYSEGERLLQKALQVQLSVATTTQRSLAKTRLLLAQTYLSNQKIVEAQEQLSELYRIWFITDTNDSLFPSKSQLFGENTLLDALDLHAELLSSQNKQRDALTAYTLAAQVADLLNNDQLHQASKLILQANDKQRSEKRLDIIYDLYKSEKNEDWLEKALRISERSKSTLVMESIKDKDLLSKHARDSLVIAYQYHGIQLSTLETQLWKLRSTKPIDVNQIEELQTMYSKTMLSQRNLRLLITDKYPTLNIQEPSVSLQILKQKATEKEETLVSYFFGKRSIYQFIIGPSNSSFEKIAPNQKVRDSIFNICVRYNQYFEKASNINNSPDAFKKDAQALYTVLKLPIAKKMIIIPDGMLAFLPFSTLLTAPSEGFVFDQMPFLLQSATITYQLSATQYFKLPTVSTKPTSVLGVFPVFGGSELALKYSVEEADAIEETFPTKLLMRDEALAENVFHTNRFENSPTNDYTILHFSTHARGGSFTTPAELQFIDQAITVNDLYSLNLKPDLVVLSACETGVGSIATGEGTLSLARGFQYAGAPNLLFSLWKVNDKATAQLMGDFYKNLKDTSSKTISLQQAQQNYLNDKTIANVKKSPYYWGAFVYYGTAEEAVTSLSWIWMVGIVIFGLFLMIIVYKKYVITP